jgi:tetratricopeptide (TPR) repeat protein
MGGFDAYRVDYSDGRYKEPENLGLCVNTKAQEYVVCVAPDADFLIVYRVDTNNEADAGLYISYRDPDGTGTDAKSMGDHINIHNATCASLSPDNQYLFFFSQGEGIYWMKAEVIDYLRVEDLRISDILHKAYVQKGLDAALVEYHELQKRHADYMAIDEYLLNGRGHQLLDANRVSEAIALFRINVAVFPASWNAYDSLGEAYLKAHETELAIQNYRRSLALNPENDNAYQVLRKLDALPER